MSAQSLRCEVCGAHPSQGITLFRTGAKGPGIDPHWRCEPHLKGFTVDEEVGQAVAQLEAPYKVKS